MPVSKPAEIPWAMMQRLLRLARLTAESLEAYKHRGQPDLVEVKLMQQVEHVEEHLRVTRLDRRRRR